MPFLCISYFIAQFPEHPELGISNSTYAFIQQISTENCSFRAPGAVRQTLQRVQFLLRLLGLCLFGKALPLTLLNGCTPTELFLLSFLSCIKDVPATDDIAATK